MNLTVSPISYRNTAVVKRNNTEKQPPEVSFGRVKISYDTAKTVVSLATFAFLAIMGTVGIIKGAYDSIKNKSEANNAQTEIVAEPTPADSISAKTFQE